MLEELFLKREREEKKKERMRQKREIKAIYRKGGMDEVKAIGLYELF